MLSNSFSTMVRNARSITAKCSIGEKCLLGCKILNFRSDEKHLTKTRNTWIKIRVSKVTHSSEQRAEFELV